MLRFASFVLTVFLAMPAFAQSAAKEFTAVRAIDVGFSESAAKCGITDAERYKAHMWKKLDEVGIKNDPNRFLQVKIDVTGTPVTNSTCILHTLIRFNAALSKENINVADPATEAALERMKVIPITLWTGGSVLQREYMTPVDGKLLDRAANGVIEQIDAIMGRFAKERAQ